MGHINKVSHVFTIGHVAEMLGEDEDWLWGNCSRGRSSGEDGLAFDGT